jgi:hypothetical protein
MTFKNNKTKTYLVVGLSLVAMLASSSSLSAVFAQVASPSIMFNAQEDEIPNTILQQASHMPQSSKDVVNLKLEQKIHGFSGVYVDDHSVLNLYTTDRTITSVDSSTLAPFLDPYTLANGIIVQHSNHSWHKWMELGSIVQTLFNQDLGMTSTYVDDKNQVYVMGFETLDSTKIAAVNKFLTDHNIPLNMVKIVKSKIQPECCSGIKVGPPIEGGAEINTDGIDADTCTTGFIVKDSSGNYRGLTVAHCTPHNDGSDKYYQPEFGRLIGNQIANTLHYGASDSTLFGVGTETGGFGKIFRYSGASVLSITAKSSYEPVGDAVCTAGTGSGTNRCGSITATGVSITDGGHLLSGQIEASYASSGGDSGSPVWHAYQFNGISAYGVHWGIDNLNGNSIYSPVWGIDSDQGTTLTYN